MAGYVPPAAARQRMAAQGAAIVNALTAPFTGPGQSGLEYGLSQLRRAAGTPGQPQTGFQAGLQLLGISGAPSGVGSIPPISSTGESYRDAELRLSAATNRYHSLPTDYKTTELAAGQAAENFRRGAGFPGQVPGGGGFVPPAAAASFTGSSHGGAQIGRAHV